jgi:hypothetical protein
MMMTVTVAYLKVYAVVDRNGGFFKLFRKIGFSIILSFFKDFS